MKTAKVYLVMRNCCTSGNCIKCMKVTKRGVPMRIEQARYTDRLKAEQVAKNWSVFRAEMVEADGTREVPTSERVFIAMALTYWGKGVNVTTALKQMYKAGAARGCSYLVYLLPEGVTDAWVDEMGIVCWKGAEGNLVEVDRHVAKKERV